MDINSLFIHLIILVFLLLFRVSSLLISDLYLMRESYTVQTRTWRTYNYL